MHRVTRAVGAALLALTCAPVQPATASELVVEATFSSTRVTGSCSRTTCTFSSRSTVCTDVGVTGSTGAPYAGTCVATISVTIPVTEPSVPVPGQFYFFACEAGTGTLTFTNEWGTTLTGRVRVVPGFDTTAGWAMSPVVNERHATVLAAEGALSAICFPTEIPRQVFSGQLRYVLVQTR